MVLWVSYKLLVGTYGEQMQAMYLPRTSDYGRVSLERLMSKDFTDFIVVGSSQTAQLSLPDGWTNLGINGQGARTGLELIRRLKLRPKVLVVEVNNLLNKPDVEVIDRALGVTPLGVQYRHRPSRVVWSWIKANYGGVWSNAVLPPQDYRRLLEIQKGWMNNVKEPKHRHLALADVATTTEGPTTVAFLLLPEDRELFELKHRAALRDELRSHYPESDFVWLDYLEDQYQTLDGRHITSDELLRFNQALGPELNSLQR